MQVLKRISNFIKSTGNDPLPILKKKQSSFKPISRSQKIKQRVYIYPCSTDQKFVFVSNVNGTGFKRTKHQSCPKQIAIESMLYDINLKCYKQWQQNRKFYHKNPFEQLDLYTNITIFIILFFSCLLLYLDNALNYSSLTNFLYLFVGLLLVSLIISLKVYHTHLKNFDSDKLMIKAIKEQLNRFNHREIQQTNNQPRFVWTCHKQCLWIALKLQSS